MDNNIPLDIAMNALVLTLETEAKALYPESRMNWTGKRQQFIESFIQDFTRSLEIENNKNKN